SALNEPSRGRRHHHRHGAGLQRHDHVVGRTVAAQDPVCSQGDAAVGLRMDVRTAIDAAMVLDGGVGAALYESAAVCRPLLEDGATTVVDRWLGGKGVFTDLSVAFVDGVGVAV